MKRFLVLLLTVIVAFSGVVILGACTELHTHEFKQEWENDKVFHWHECVLAECMEVSDKAEHDWTSENVCSVCGYTKTNDDGNGNGDGNGDGTVGDLTDEQWQEAFLMEKFSCVTGRFEIVEAEGRTQKQTLKIAGDRVLRTVEADFGEGDVWSDKAVFTGKAATEQKEAFFAIFFALLRDKSNFKYDADLDAYVTDGEVVVNITIEGHVATEKMSNATVRFNADGTLAYFSCHLNESSNGEVIVDGTLTFALTEYGTTQITPEDEEGAQIVDGNESEHTHEFILPKYDELMHWTECSCGDFINKSEHEFVVSGNQMVCSECEYSKELEAVAGSEVTDEQWAAATAESVFNNFTFDNTLIMNSMTQAERVQITENMMAVQISEFRNIFTEEYLYYYDGQMDEYKNSYKALIMGFLSDKSKYVFDDELACYTSTEEISVTVTTQGYTQRFALKPGSMVKFGADAMIASVEGAMAAYSGGNYDTELYWGFSNYGTTSIVLPKTEATVPDLEFGEVDLDKIQDLLFIKCDNVQFAIGKDFDSQGRLVGYAEDTAVYSGNILKNGNYEYIAKEGETYYEYSRSINNSWKRIKSEYIRTEDDFYSESDFRFDNPDELQNLKFNAATGLYELDYSSCFYYYGPCKNFRIGFVEGKLRYFYFEREYESGAESEIRVEKIEQFIEYKTESLSLPEVDRLSPSIPNDYYQAINENAWANAMKNQVYSHSMERVTTVSRDGQFVSETVETILVDCFGTTVTIQVGNDAFYVKEDWKYTSIIRGADGEWVSTSINSEAFERVYGSGNLQGYYAHSVFDQVERTDYTTGLYTAKTVTSQYGDVYSNFIVGFDYSSRIKYLCYTVADGDETVMTQYYVTYAPVEVALPELN